MGNQTKLPPVVEPRPVLLSTHKKTRYSDSELKEFKILIQKKLKKTKEEYELLKNFCFNPNGTNGTAPVFKAFEEGSETMSKESNRHLVIRQEKFIGKLKNSLLRIKNKNYGICRITGNLIPKQRLILTLHATLTVEGKKIEEQRKK